MGRPNISWRGRGADAQRFCQQLRGNLPVWQPFSPGGGDSSGDRSAGAGLGSGPSGKRRLKSEKGEFVTRGHLCVATRACACTCTGPQTIPRPITCRPMDSSSADPALLHLDSKPNVAGVGFHVHLAAVPQRHQRQNCEFLRALSRVRLHACARES